MEYIVKNKTFIKSSNSTKKIYDRYFISLVSFALIISIINLIIGNKELVLSLIKSIGIVFIVMSILAYIINLLLKKNDFLKIYNEDNIHIIALIYGLLGINVNIYILLLGIVVTLIIKYLFKKINLSCTLYGLLVIILGRYFINDINTPLMELHNAKYLLSCSELLNLGGGIKNYLVGINNLAPLLVVFVFIYLFYKRSIKYNLVISYILTIFIIMALIGIIKDFNIWFGLFQILSGYLLFLVIYTLSDYMVSPTIKEGQIIYGIILGIISSVLRFIVPDMAIVISFIFGELCLVKVIENNSAKFKYNKKVYNTVLVSLIIIMIIVIAVISKII